MDTLLQYKCPSCGGSLAFNSDVQMLKCPYCDTELDVKALEALDQALETQPQEDMSWEQNGGTQWQEGEEANLRTYVCQSCGGEVVGDATTAATTCPYCDNPVVMAGQLSGALKPDLLIPFQLDQEDAKAALLKHVTGKPLLPKVFKSENRLKEIKGIYVPFWLYDAHADADVTYHATRSRSWVSGEYVCHETCHYRVERAGDLRFSAVPVDGSSKMPDDLMESIEPYDLSQAKPFQTAYLAGYFADKYDVDSEKSQERANDRIRESAQEELRETVTGYGSVVAEHTAVRLKESRSRYALYPVWMLTTRYKEQNYTFAMNGQTGRFVGNLPTNWVAFWLWFVGLTLSIGVIGSFLFGECLASFAVGLLFGFVITAVMRSQLKTVKPQQSARSYVEPGSLNLYKRTDLFLYRNMTRTRRAKNNK